MTTPETTTRPKVLTRDMLMPFMLVAILFPLWGFANDVTNPLVKAFKDIFLISNTQSSMVEQLPENQHGGGSCSVEVIARDTKDTDNYFTLSAEKNTPDHEPGAFFGLGRDDAQNSCLRRDQLSGWGTYRI